MANDFVGTGVRNVTPNDNDSIPGGKDNNFPRAFYCKTAEGNIAFEALDGSSNMKPCALGEIVPISVRKILLSGTTATGIVVIY